MAGYFVKNRTVIAADSSIRVPTGTTAVRPAAPSAGSFRFNTDIAGLEFFNGTTFQTVAAAGKANITVDTFTGDGSTLTFSMNETADTVTEILVFVGSVYQEPTTVYSVTGGGNDITFTEAVPSGMSINVIHGFATTGA